MLYAFLLAVYLFIGLVISIISHAGLTIADNRGMAKGYTFIADTIESRNIYCPVFMGLFWPFGIVWLVILFSGTGYELISSYLVSQLNKALKIKE